MVHGLGHHRLEAKLLAKLFGFLNSGEPENIKGILREKLGRVLVRARAKLGRFKPDLIEFLPVVETDCAKLELAQKLLISGGGCLCHVNLLVFD